MNVVHQHTCSVGYCCCLSSRYIGHTTKTLSKNITVHFTVSANWRQYMHEHGIILKRKHLDNNTNIPEKDNDHKRLRMKEAVPIYSENSGINKPQAEYSLRSKRQPANNLSLLTLWLTDWAFILHTLPLTLFIRTLSASWYALHSWRWSCKELKGVSNLNGFGFSTPNHSKS